MNLLLVFNHHSLPYQSAKNAQNAIAEFLKICIKANNLGYTTILVDESVDRNWFRLKLAENFYWQDWYNLNKNKDESKDLIRAFRRISTKQPFFDELDIAEGLDLFEVKINNIEYSAIRAAAWKEAPITSFPTQIPWNRSPLDIDIKTIDNHSELSCQKKSLLNFFSLEVLDSQESNIIVSRNSILNTVQDLYNKRDELFPNICVCGKAIEQLSKWSESLTIFNQVKESLTSLNSFCEKWQNGYFNSYTDENVRLSGLNHQVSGESETVKKNPELRRQREFFLSNGIKVLFEKHIKLSNGFRIHFYPENSTKTIYVAYIGKHLKLN